MASLKEDNEQFGKTLYCSFKSLLEYFLHPCKKYSDSFALQNMSKICCISPSMASLKEDMAKYVCTLCGWVYDPAEGDPDGGVAPGTAFEDIPEDWVCPVCGATKSAFEKV